MAYKLERQENLLRHPGFCEEIKFGVDESARKLYYLDGSINSSQRDETLHSRVRLKSTRWFGGCRWLDRGFTIGNIGYSYLSGNAPSNREHQLFRERGV